MEFQPLMFGQKRLKWLRVEVGDASEESSLSDMESGDRDTTVEMIVEKVLKAGTMVKSVSKAIVDHYRY